MGEISVPMTCAEGNSSAKSLVEDVRVTQLGNVGGKHTLPRYLISLSAWSPLYPIFSTGIYTCSSSDVKNFLTIRSVIKLTSRGQGYPYLYITLQGCKE